MQRKKTLNYFQLDNKYILIEVINYWNVNEYFYGIILYKKDPDSAATPLEKEYEKFSLNLKVYSSFLINILAENKEGECASIN